MLLQFPTVRLIKNYDNESLQSTIAWLLQFSTTVITIHDECYYNLRQVLLKIHDLITIHGRRTQVYLKKANTPSGTRKYYCGVLRRYVSQNIVSITGTLPLNRFTLLYVFN